MIPPTAPPLIRIAGPSIGVGKKPTALPMALRWIRASSAPSIQIPGAPVGRARDLVAQVGERHAAGRRHAVGGTPDERIVRAGTDVDRGVLEPRGVRRVERTAGDLGPRALEVETDVRRAEDDLVDDRAVGGGGAAAQPRIPGAVGHGPVPIRADAVDTADEPDDPCAGPLVDALRVPGDHVAPSDRVAADQGVLGVSDADRRRVRSSRDTVGAPHTDPVAPDLGPVVDPARSRRCVARAGGGCGAREVDAGHLRVHDDVAWRRRAAREAAVGGVGRAADDVRARGIDHDAVLRAIGDGDGAVVALLRRPVDLLAEPVSAQLGAVGAPQVNAAAELGDRKALDDDVSCAPDDEARRRRAGAAQAHTRIARRRLRHGGSPNCEGVVRPTPHPSTNVPSRVIAGRSMPARSWLPRRR